MELRRVAPLARGGDCLPQMTTHGPTQQRPVDAGSRIAGNEASPMFARGMTSRGKQVTALIALALMLFLPKHVECGYPGGACAKTGPFRMVCRPWEVEPLGFYLIELIAERDVGFAYSTGEDCR